jgi:putative oxidoreductase
MLGFGGKTGLSARSTEHSQEEPEIRFESETNMDIQSEWILLIARVILAAVMIFYGWPKIRDLASNANDFEEMGFKPGILWGTLIAIVEFAGGIAILLGFYAELAAASFGFQMMVGAFWKLKVKKPFSDYSYDMQLFALCLVVMSQGAGAYALKAFPGTMFLRWDIAALSLAAALLFAVLSKPHLKSAPQLASA